jgi:V/A-type H+-transporting ATPase subunit F
MGEIKMKAYFISDNNDTFIGLKIAGIKGAVLHEREQVLKKLEEIKMDNSIGIIILTEKISMLVPDEVKEMKLKKHAPLIVEIPDRHGSMKGDDSIVRYVKESIGLKI